MMIQINFYGPLADLIDREVEFAPEALIADVAALRNALAKRYPEARETLLSPRTKCVIGDVVAGEQTRLIDGAPVEFFPPVSGG